MHRKARFWVLALFLAAALCGCANETKNTPNPPQNDSTGTQDATNNPQDGSTGTQDAGQESEIVQKIKERGYLLAGCKTDVPGLSLYDSQTDTWAGLEVELAYQTAAELFGVSIGEAKQQGLVSFVGVTVADREEKLEQREVDCLFATYTITQERKQKFAFSDSYYTDYIGMMVRETGTDANSLGTSDIRSIADLDGKKIGVAKHATTRKMFLDYMETMNSIKTAPMFFEYKSYEALFSALKEGSIDVMAVDVSILNGYVDSQTKILNDRFGGQRYGAAVRREDAELLLYVNAAIAQ